MAVIIPLVIIFASLMAIMVIVARKFSALANLDVDTIPAEKEAKFKEQLVESRLSRNMARASSRLIWGANNIWGRFLSLFSGLTSKLDNLKKEYESSEELGEEQKKKEAEKLLNSISEMDPRDDFSDIEKALIEAIGLDSRNIEAFKELGELYHKNKRYEEAEQSLEHTLKLLGDEEVSEQADVYFDLALVAADIGDPQKADERIRKAVKLSPNNPRFLDAMLEISIMNKDKMSAREALDRLKQANPDNKKIEERESKLEELE